MILPEITQRFNFFSIKNIEENSV